MLQVAFAIVQILLIGLADYITGYELSFSILYLVPVTFTTWFVGRNMGVLTAIISAFVWFKVDIFAGHLYSHFAIPYWNALVRLGFFLIVSFMLSRLKSSLEIEKRLSRTDSLTGVANSRDFYDSANKEIYKAGRYKQPFTAIYFDVDNFKGVNDHFGHKTGDSLLCAVAQTVKKNIRLTDVFARLGGDEFALLLPETGPEAARKLVAKLNLLLLETVNENKWPVTFSFGVVTFNRPPESVDAMIKKIDNVMYTVKNSGKNAVKFEVD